MGTKRYENIDNRTGNKRIKTVTRSGNSTRVRVELHKPDKILGTYLFGEKKTLSDKTHRKG